VEELRLDLVLVLTRRPTPTTPDRLIDRSIMQYIIYIYNMRTAHTAAVEVSLPVGASRTEGAHIA
jgi:hypothetical protein